jgi:hypothetical protein
MKMNKKLMIAIPVAAGVLALATGVGIASAKGADQAASYRNVSDYVAAPATIDSNNTNPSVYCGEVGGMMNWGAGQGLLSQQVATLLGTTVADLQSQLNSGKTLMDIAGAKGVSQDQLTKTMMAPFNDQMALMLKYGYLTQDQVNTMTAQMQQRLQTMVTSQINTGNGFGWGYMMQGNGNGYGPGSMMQGYRGGMMGGYAPQTQNAPTNPRGGFGGMMGRW